MRFEDFSKTAERLTYKPGFFLKTFEWPIGISVHIWAEDVPDVRNPENRAPLVMKFYLDAAGIHALDEKGFLNFMRNCYLELERHECLEWIRFDGVQVFNPHNNKNSLEQMREALENAPSGAEDFGR